jgi:hypothetical protein
MQFSPPCQSLPISLVGVEAEVETAALSALDLPDPPALVVAEEEEVAERDEILAARDPSAAPAVVKAGPG